MAKKIAVPQAVTALQIYNAYPDSDLLLLEPPDKNESIKDFSSKIADCGDTLFKFIIYELSDCTDDTNECLRRLYRAMHDLDTMCDIIALENL
jgi:hypothetical protein